MWSINTLDKEIDAFKSLSLEDKKEKILNWVSKLSKYYGYFDDLRVYIEDHKSELDEEFLDAVFQIIINLAEEVDKI